MSRTKETADDCRLESSMLYAKVGLLTSGRSKRNIPLPVFQNEPKGIIIEYTYKS